MPLADHPRLRRIALAYSVNETGRWFALIAVSLIVYARTGHSAVAVAAVLVTPLLPALLAPAVVARVEASRRRGTLSALYALEALSAVALAGALWRFSLPAILILIGIDGAASFPARALLRSEATRAGGAREGRGADEGRGSERAQGPAGGERERSAAIHLANSTLNVCLAVTGMAGPRLAGLSVSALGGPVSLLAAAGCLALCGLLTGDLRPFVEEAGTSVWIRLRAAREHIGESPGMAALLGTEAVAVMLFTAAVPVELLYAKHTLNAGNPGYGGLIAAWGAGMLAGSALFARAGGARGGARARRARGPASETMLWGGTLAVGLAFVGFAAAPSLWLAYLAAALGGLGNGTQWPALLDQVQRSTPPHLLGRMMGAVEGLGGVAPVLGYALGGLLGTLLAPRGALLLDGLAATAVTLAFLRLVPLLAGRAEP
ncbi:MAG: hypothetical protein KGJ43_07420, partial [Acidobacteriota bacterium]|nr:hypothetical protein [Acidobacteriota bacterium]